MGFGDYGPTPGAVRRALQMQGLPIRVNIFTNDIAARIEQIDSNAKVIIARVLRKAAGPMVTAIRAAAPMRYGFLKRSIGALSKTGRRQYVVLGPRRGMPYAVLRKRHTSKAAQIAEPANYAHLVEFGHGGPHPAEAHPFFFPAVSAQGGAVMNVLQTEMKAALSESERLFGKGAA